MKKIFILFAILTLTLTSCATTKGINELTTLEDINSYIYYNIEWEDIPDTKKTVSTPQETLARGVGSCYDMSVLFVELAERAGFIATLYPVVTIEGTQHMCVYCDNYIWDPTNFDSYYVLPFGWEEWEGTL